MIAHSGLKTALLGTATLYGLGSLICALAPNMELMLGFVTEEKLMLQPFSFYVKCFSISDLHAGKLHALLYRSWKNRAKGRDWYDFEWYVRHRHPVHLAHFLVQAQESGQLESLTSIDLDAVKILLHERVEQVDFELAKADVMPFIKDAASLELWSSQYFHDLTEQLLGTQGC